MSTSYDEFLNEVRELGEYADREEADQVSRAVLGVLAPRLPANGAEHLVAQLPDELSDAVRQGELLDAESFGVEEFLTRVAAATGARPKTAEWDASAVLTTVAHRITGGQLNHILSQLPSGFAVLFGKPELSD
ncbi:hypothetical protein A6A08_16830 [Nocardiopsis sp. TSRI0078]|uniref:DUF2267 domain-containing protein n=1 Tax=unclassified Nocardiopsis TaxID=2649073 RepID=UPI00093B0C4E|nr:DUF2267 domain-containing protein [Nocardiopsis sp. TSRI0078]OKI13092.1 hypothetical protein A6A08_16830 [Nocardiopsis sp. TSRI0078]